MSGRWSAFIAGVRTRGRLAEWTMLAGVAATSAAFSFVLATRLVVRSTDSVTLDDLTGRDAGDAAVWLAAHRLRAEVSHFEDNDRAEPLTVVFQEPAPGEELRPGLVVRLVISRGARSIPVPDVRGSYLSQARLILERNGLAFGGSLEIHDPSPSGTVLATSPGQSGPVRGGSPVSLLVSAGPAPRQWVVPDVTWRSYDEVKSLGDEMGVPVVIGARLNTADEAEGAILEQFPAAGLQVSEGQAIRVTVNGEGDRPAAAAGDGSLVTLAVSVPRGFLMHTLKIMVGPEDGLRTLYDESVMSGEWVRVAASVLPGDRAIAVLDGHDVLRKTW